jgi:proteic killer suppression protein
MVTIDVTNGGHYCGDPVIRSFADKEAVKIWNQEYSRKLPPQIQERGLMKLQQLHAANDLRDLAIPVSNQLEALKGDLRDVYSIRINRQWRICFRWHGGHAWEVRITDYH